MVVVPPKAAGDGAALEVVGAHQAERRQLGDVAVALDATGQHQLARGVDLVVAACQLIGQGGDAAVADADVAAHAVTGGDHGAATDDEVEGPAHRRLFWR